MTSTYLILSSSKHIMTLIQRLSVMNAAERIGKKKSTDRWNMTYSVQEEGREVIQQWREKRLRLRGARKAYHEFLVYSFDMDTFRSFLSNINFMVVVQIALAIVSVYIFQKFNIFFNLHVSLFVSPIVFPLAFSINTDFQRKEKVLEDLAIFKSSGMLWYFCMREWKSAAELDNDWISAVHGKLKSLLFHLREYLLTYKPERRKMILRCMYEDFSDSNQLIERVRASVLPANTAIVSRSIHLLNMMCLSFERLRVVREYRSPRSIRSFNKVFILILPIILSPYFVYLGVESKNVWQPYYMAVLVAFVFSALQGTQDKLDDPFDGMSEDDINLDTIDEWTFSSLEHTMKRTFDVGRFKVTVDPQNDPIPTCKDHVRSPSIMRRPDTLDVADHRNIHSRRSSVTSPLARMSSVDPNEIQKKLAPMLEGLSGEERISRKSVHRKSSEVSDPPAGNLEYNLSTIFEPSTVNSTEAFEEDNRKVTFEDELLFLHPLETCANPLDAPDDLMNQELTNVEMLSTNTVESVAIDMTGLKHSQDSTKSLSSKGPAWLNRFNVGPGNFSSLQKESETSDCSVNRFCIKSSGTTGIESNVTPPTSISNIETTESNRKQDFEMKAFTPTERHVSPPLKSQVKSAETPPDVYSCGLLNEGRHDTETRPLLQLREGSDSFLVSSDCDDIPDVVFLNGLYDANIVDNSTLPPSVKNTNLRTYANGGGGPSNIPLDKSAGTCTLSESTVGTSNPVSPV